MINRYRTRIAFCVVTFVILAGVIRLSAQGTVLSLEQVRKLVEIQAPDDVVAQEIRARGLSFAVTSQILDQMRAGGAGKDTLAVLKERLPIGALEIQALPQSEVLLDAASGGTTDAQGRLVINEVAAGQHRVSINKSGYTPMSLDVTVAAKEYKRLPVSLQWAGGFLTVRPNVQGTIVDIAGVGDYRDGVSELPIPAGKYQVIGYAPGMKQEMQTIEIGSGTHTTLELRLALDADYARVQLAEARQGLARGDFRGVIDLTGRMLSLKPRDPDFESLLATAYLQAHDFQRFQSTAKDALLDGGTLVLEFMHEHLELGGEAIHPATITLSSKEMVYDSKGSPCKYRTLSIGIREIEKIEATNKATSGVMVVHHLAPESFLLHLEVRDPSKPIARVQLSFAVPGSRVEGRPAVLNSPQYSSQMLAAIGNVIRAAAGQ